MPKGRFRRLKLMETVRLDLIPMQIMSACILHDICIFENDIIDFDIESELWEENTMDIQVIEDYHESERNGIEKRNDIANVLPLQI